MYKPTSLGHEKWYNKVSRLCHPCYAYRMQCFHYKFTSGFFGLLKLCLQHKTKVNRLANVMFA